MGCWGQIRHVLLPAALPGYLAGLRQGWAFAWRSLMAAELIVTSTKLGFGLGQLLNQGRDLSDMPLVLAAIILIFIVGVGIEVLFFRPAERARAAVPRAAPPVRVSEPGGGSRRRRWSVSPTAAATRGCPARSTALLAAVAALPPGTRCGTGVSRPRRARSDGGGARPGRRPGRGAAAAVHRGVPHQGRLPGGHPAAAAATGAELITGPTWAWDPRCSLRCARRAAEADIDDADRDPPAGRRFQRRRRQPPGTAAGAAMGGRAERTGPRGLRDHRAAGGRSAGRARLRRRDRSAVRGHRPAARRGATAGRVQRHDRCGAAGHAAGRADPAALRRGGRRRPPEVQPGIGPERAPDSPPRGKFARIGGQPQPSRAVP